MTNYNGKIFADYQLKQRIFDITCNKDENGNPVETDIMPNFLVNNYKYMFNVEIEEITTSDGSPINVKINGMKFLADQTDNWDIFTIPDVLVRSFTVDNDCTIKISYCL